MSSDNYLMIKKELGYWVGYIESAATYEPVYNTCVFKAPTLEDAIRNGQKIDVEYGMRFSLFEDLGKLDTNELDYPMQICTRVDCQHFRWGEQWGND